MLENKNFVIELADDDLNNITGGTQYTGYGSPQNANAAMGYRASKVDAMRKAGGGGEIVAQGRTEDGGYFTTIERAMGNVMDAMNSAVGGTGVDGAVANASGANGTDGAAE